MCLAKAKASVGITATESGARMSCATLNVRRPSDPVTEDDPRWTLTTLVVALGEAPEPSGSETDALRVWAETYCAEVKISVTRRTPIEQGAKPKVRPRLKMCDLETRFFFMISPVIYAAPPCRPYGGVA